MLEGSGYVTFQGRSTGLLISKIVPQFARRLWHSGIMLFRRWDLAHEFILSTCRGHHGATRPETLFYNGFWNQFRPKRSAGHIVMFDDLTLLRTLQAHWSIDRISLVSGPVWQKDWSDVDSAEHPQLRRMSSSNSHWVLSNSEILAAKTGSGRAWRTTAFRISLGEKWSRERRWHHR